MPELFVKKPVVVEATQFDGYNWMEVQAFCGSHRDSGDQWDISSFNPIGTYIQSEDPDVVAEVWDKVQSCWVTVKRNDWIIKGIKGEFYPCGHDVFRETYERMP